MRDPHYLDSMALVDNLCFWLKRYLWHLTGVSKANMQKLPQLVGLAVLCQTGKAQMG